MFPVPCDLKPEAGYVRVYTDHTGRWYEDILKTELERINHESRNDPLMKILGEELMTEINREIVRAVVKETYDNAD